MTTQLVTNASPRFVSKATVNDANYVISVSNGLCVCYSAISTNRTVTLPPATTSGQLIGIIDESGSCSSTKTIRLIANGSDTIHSFTYNAQFGYPHASAMFESDGNGNWIEVFSNAYHPSSTGLISGGALTINSDNTKFDIAALTAYFADYSNPMAMTGSFISYGPTLANTVPDIATQNVTYVGINSSGTLIKQADPFTREQRRTIVSLGVVVHSNRTNINTTNCIAAVVREPVPQIHDLMEAIGPLNLSGNTYSAHDSTLNIDKTAGTLFKFGSNFVNNANDPHAISQGSGTALTFRYRLSDGTEYTDTTSIDPDYYEASGVRTALSPSSPFSVQRIAMFSSGLTRIQYGQMAYKDLAEALSGYQNEAFTVEQNIRENGIFRCMLIVKKGCTNLSDTTQALFLNVSKFGAAASSGAAVDWAEPGAIGSVTPNTGVFTSLSATTLSATVATVASVVSSPVFLVPSASTTTADATLSVNSTLGVRLQAKTGSVYDLAIVNPGSGSSTIMGVPTGTINMSFLGRTTAVGSTERDADFRVESTSSNTSARNFSIGETQAFGQLDIRISNAKDGDPSGANGTSLAKFTATTASILTVAAFSDLAVLPKTSGKGIKVDIASPTFAWNDLLGHLYARGTAGATTPTWATYRGTINAYQFSVNDEVQVEFHIPHDYAPGTDIYIHAHWSHTATTVTGGSVTWGFETTSAKGHNQAAFAAPVTPTVAQNASTTQYQHMIAEVQLSAASPSGTQINQNTLEPDTIILVRAYLSANAMTVSSGGVPEPFLHYVDIHYQTTNIGTKAKAPNFYT